MSEFSILPRWYLDFCPLHSCEKNARCTQYCYSVRAQFIRAAFELQSYWPRWQAIMEARLTREDPEQRRAATITAARQAIQVAA